MVFTKQLSLFNFAVMSIIINYLPKSNGKDSCLKSCFCLSCKNVEMLLRSFWHNTVDIKLNTMTMHSYDFLFKRLISWLVFNGIFSINRLYHATAWYVKL